VKEIVSYGKKSLLFKKNIYWIYGYISSATTAKREKKKKKPVVFHCEKRLVTESVPKQQHLMQRSNLPV